MNHRRLDPIEKIEQSFEAQRAKKAPMCLQEIRVHADDASELPTTMCGVPVVVWPWTVRGTAVSLFAFGLGPRERANAIATAEWLDTP